MSWRRITKLLQSVQTVRFQKSFPKHPKKLGKKFFQNSLLNMLLHVLKLYIVKKENSLLSVIFNYFI